MKVEWLRGAIFLLILRPLVIFVMGVRVIGKENLRSSPFILIANHASHVDTLILLSLFPVREFLKIRPVAAEDYWTRNRLVYLITKFLFNILPIPRKGFTPRKNPIRKMEEALMEGYSLIIYPEGTRSYGEDIGPFKPGVAHLLESHPEIPCIPVYIRNTNRVLPKGAVLAVPLFVDVAVGKPIRIEAGTPRQEILKELRKAVEDLREEVNKL